MKTFPRQRDDYSPYGFTCELWSPTLMPRFDHHNEIEINFIARGSLEYFFHDRTITLPEGTIALFWAFLPHRITGFTEGSHYYVITIPLATFLEWNLSENFLKNLFSGRVLTDSTRPAAENLSQFDRWHNDIDDPRLSECMRLELRARIARMDIALTASTDSRTPAGKYPLDKIQRMILYISNNSHNPISTSDVAASVGLNPDYAGALFRKTIGQTLTDYIAKERIAIAQRALMFTDESITQIAYLSGFSTISNFNITFKRITGHTPRAYRRHLHR